MKIYTKVLLFYHMLNENEKEEFVQLIGQDVFNRIRSLVDV